MNFTQRMKKARLDSGLSLVDATFEIRSWLPRADWVGIDVVRRLETNTPEAKADPVLVAALAKVYGVDVTWLSEVAAEGLSKVRELVRSRCSPRTAALTCADAA